MCIHVGLFGKRGVAFLRDDGVRIKFHGGLAVYRIHLSLFWFLWDSLSCDVVVRPLAGEVGLRIERVFPYCCNYLQKL